MTTEQCEGLTEAQNKALLALLQANSITEAAKACGLTRQTISSYLADDKFSKEYYLARREQLERATRAVERYALEAVEILREIMNDKENSAASRTAAARAISERAKERTEADLLLRVEILERKK